MSKIVICDDDRNWLDHAEHVLERYLDEAEEKNEIICGEDVDSIIDRLSEPPDLWFMDIELTKGVPDGIRGMEKVNDHYPGCRTVYLTNYLNYAVDVYHTDHMWYVLKDQFEERLPEIFRKFKTMQAEADASLIISTTDGKVIKLKAGNILCAERAGRHTEISTTEGVYSVREKIGEIGELLPKNLFFRCHNSIIVSFLHVKQIRPETILLDDDTELPASRSYRKDFRLKYVSWSREHTVD